MIVNRHKAQEIAYRAHDGDVRKVTGNAYITHSQKVADRIAKILPSDDLAYAIAILHDVLDVPTACERIGGREGLLRNLGDRAVDLVNGVVAMTKDRTILDSDARSRDMLQRCAEASDWRVWLCEIVDKWATVDDLPAEIETYGYDDVSSKFSGRLEHYLEWVELVHSTMFTVVRDKRDELEGETFKLCFDELDLLQKAIERLRVKLSADLRDQCA